MREEEKKQEDSKTDNDPTAQIYSQYAINENLFGLLVIYKLLGENTNYFLDLLQQYLLKISFQISIRKNNQIELAVISNGSLSSPIGPNAALNILKEAIEKTDEYTLSSGNITSETTKYRFNNSSVYNPLFCSHGNFRYCYPFLIDSKDCANILENSAFSIGNTNKPLSWHTVLDNKNQLVNISNSVKHLYGDDRTEQIIKQKIDEQDAKLKRISQAIVTDLRNILQEYIEDKQEKNQAESNKNNNNFFKSYQQTKELIKHATAIISSKVTHHPSSEEFPRLDKMKAAQALDDILDPKFIGERVISNYHIKVLMSNQSTLSKRLEVITMQYGWPLRTYLDCFRGENNAGLDSQNHSPLAHNRS